MQSAGVKSNLVTGNYPSSRAETAGSLGSLRWEAGRWLLKTELELDGVMTALRERGSSRSSAAIPTPMSENTNLSPEVKARRVAAPSAVTSSLLGQMASYHAVPSNFKGSRREIMV